MEYSTLQGIGLSGSYWYENVHNLFKENPWRVVQEIANLEQQSQSYTKKPSKGLVYQDLTGMRMSIIYSRKTLGGLSMGLQTSQTLTMKLGTKNTEQDLPLGF